MTTTAINSATLDTIVNATGPAKLCRRLIPPAYLEHCPHCGSSAFDLFKDGNWYVCKDCKSWGDILDYIMVAFEIDSREGAIEYLSHRLESIDYRAVI